MGPREPNSLGLGTVTTALLAKARASVEDALYGFGLKAARALARVRAAWVAVGGERFAYLERKSGTGARTAATIVLLHGFAANKDMWIRFVRHLPAEYRIIVPDLPGHGESSFRWSQCYDQEGFVRALGEGLGALGLRRFHLAGASLGGLLATLYAARHPQRVQTLSLFDPAGVRPSRRSDMETLLLEHGENPLLVDSRDDFQRLVDFVYHRPPALPWPLRPALARQQMARFEMNRKMWRDLLDNFEDTRELLPELRMPVLLVWGERDRILDPSAVPIYERYVPRLQALILENVGHSPVTERPARSARLFVNFLRRAADTQGAGANEPKASAG